jgi:dephospho-CoA kinase
MVAASGVTQIQRICASRAIAPAEAKAFIQAQLPISFKIERSNTVIWNDGSRAVLEDQTTLLAAMREAA